MLYEQGKTMQLLGKQYYNTMCDSQIYKELLEVAAAHIKKLGATLESIDDALALKDLKEVPADKLLKLKLLYEDKLQSLYIEPTDGQESFTEYNEEELLKAVAALYEKLKTGAITTQQGKAELATIEGVRKAIIAKENSWI